jgi:hypothetical protein
VKRWYDAEVEGKGGFDTRGGAFFDMNMCFLFLEILT